MPAPVVALGAALLLALVHVFAPAMRFLEGTPRSKWLSIFGGISVAYVFVQLLPELAEAETQIRKAVGDVGLGVAERHVYLVALAGLATFYGLDRLAKSSREAEAAKQPEHGGRIAHDTSTSPRVFWIHINSFAVYNALIGYLLLHREKTTLISLGFYAVAMALHFVVTDYGLNEDHKQRYRHVGRWLLVTAVLGGFVTGYLTSIAEAAIAVLIAFLAGGVILNVLKEELPEERKSNFWAFAAGLVLYSALLLII